MNATGFSASALSCGIGLMVFAVTGHPVMAETTNAPATSNAPAPATAVSNAIEAISRSTETAAAAPSTASGLNESTFRIIADRNIFNANRSGGPVRASSSRRPSRVESFTLVGTMAYEKGAFAFFNGSNSEFTKAIKAGGIIGGHKVADVLAGGVKLEADGKLLDLPVGSSMRREDEGAWHVGEGVISAGGTSYAANRENGVASRSSRGDSSSRNGRSSSETAPNNANPNADEIRKEEKREEKEIKKELKQDSKAEADLLKRMMERREKENP